MVEDNYETVADAVHNLVKEGSSVQYWNGDGDFPKNRIHNARVVIIDLDLTGKGSRAMGPEYYYPAAKALEKIPGPFVVIVFATEFLEEDPSNLKSYYENAYGSLHGFFSESGVSKDTELEDPGKLKKVIESTIRDNKVLQLILAWEQALDYAKDRSLGEFVQKEIKGTILRLIKLICKGRGDESTSRDFIQIMMRLVSRRIIEHDNFKEITEIIMELKKLKEKPANVDGDNDLMLYNKLMYFTPKKEEDVFTGDIFETSKTLSERYAIVLTPKCDLIQKKTNIVQICYAFPIHEDLLTNQEFPPRNIDPKIIDKKKNSSLEKTIIQCLKERYILCTQSPPDNLHFLWNFVCSDKVMGLCVDFRNVKSIKIEELKKSKRLCRLDTPFIQEIRAEYGRFLSRVGTPDTNKCPSKLRE